MAKIGVVIPCYNSKDSILKVIEQITAEVDLIYVIDDSCPQKSGKFVQDNITDSRVRILYNKKNLGVGGAVIAGYKQALLDNCDIVVKIDSDLQMDPKLIDLFIEPIIKKRSDYTKGNRFFYLKNIRLMPLKRVFGNLILSFMTKISSGYWDIFDPTNGYTAISAKILKMLDLDQISKRYFFESDMLFRLGILKAVVLDIPINPIYNSYGSNLNILKNIPIFLFGNIKNSCKRIIYNYYIRDFSISSINLILSILFLAFGIITGLEAWNKSIQSNIVATPGTVMLSALPIIVGIQLLISFIDHDISNIPRTPLQSRG